LLDITPPDLAVAIEEHWAKSNVPTTPGIAEAQRDPTAIIAILIAVRNQILEPDEINYDLSKLNSCVKKVSELEATDRKTLETLLSRDDFEFIQDQANLEYTIDALVKILKLKEATKDHRGLLHIKQGAAARVLGYMGIAKPNIISTLESLLDHSNMIVKIPAAMALVMLGKSDQKLFPILLEGQSFPDVEIRLDSGRALTLYTRMFEE